MAHVIADRVSDTATTTGTGDFTVSGSAPTGFRTLSAVLSNTDTFYYVIAHQSANEWEVGLGTHSGGNVFVRTTPIASSNGGSAVDFSAGTKDVFLSQPAARDNPRLFGLTDNRLIRADGIAGNLQQTGITVDDSDDITGIGNTQFKAGSGVRAGTTAADTLLLQARDVDGSTWTTAVRLTSADTPLFELVSLDLDFNGRNALFDDNTGIKDDSGNELIIFQKTASAVNQIDVTNAATGSGPSIAATGGDTDIDLLLVSKGAGKAKSNGNAIITRVARQIFTASGTYTPTSGMLYCIIECIGGGGGGGGVDGTTGGANAGGGGGAGAYSKIVATAATIGASQTVTIGALGAGGASGNNGGSTGGDTSVGTICVAKGGVGGTGANQLGTIGSGGAGGSAASGTGDTKFNGGNGYSAFYATITTARGAIAHGGISRAGPGGIAAAISDNTAVAGVAASAAAYGGGGAGAQFHNTTSDAAGGNGAAGIVIITEYLA